MEGSSNNAADDNGGDASGVDGTSVLQSVTARSVGNGSSGGGGILDNDADSSINNDEQQHGGGEEEQEYEQEMGVESTDRAVVGNDFGVSKMSQRTTGTRAFDELQFIDHFSLGSPSSTVRFRGARVMVYEENGRQMVLEDRIVDDENRRHAITVKSMSGGNFGLRFLRMTYTLVALVMTGFLFVFCFQIILFLFINLPASSGATSSEPQIETMKFIGAVLSIPLFLHAMGNIMALGLAFISDTWDGHPLFRAMLDWPIVPMEWFTFIIFLGIPILTIIITLFIGRDDWWEVSVGTWMITVFVFFGFFCCTVVVREFQACLDLVVIYDSTDKSRANAASSTSPPHQQQQGEGGNEIMYDSAYSNENESKWSRRLRLVKRAILLSQTEHFSGVKQERYLVGKYDDLPKSGGYVNSDDHTPVQTRISWYSRLTTLKCLKCIYEEADPPTKAYSVDEIRDTLTFITNTNWSLEAMYCRSSKARAVTAVSGPNQLTNPQVNSSFFCISIGLLLSTLAIIAALVWLDSPASTVIIIGCLVIFCCVWPAVKSSRNTVRTFKSMDHDDIDEMGGGTGADIPEDVEFTNRNNHSNDEDAETGNNNVRAITTTSSGDENNPSTGLYQIWETVTISRPKPCYCWTRLGLDIILLYLWPLITLYVIDNNRTATLFLIIGLGTFVRIYFDASSILTELGTMDDIDLHTGSGTRNGSRSDSTWRSYFTKLSERAGVNGMKRLGETEDERILLAKARTSQVIGKISRSKARNRWMWVFGIFATVAALMILSADDLQETDPQGDRPPLAQVNDFYYEPQPGLPYPTCEMAKSFATEVGPSPMQFLSDYSLFAAISYETQNVAQYVLDQRFGEGVVVDETEYVDQYRNDSGTRSNPVFFKLFSFPAIPGYGVVAIRGSQTTWDFLVDAQLWMAAFFAQIVRAITPFGWVFTPILDDLVTTVNWVESAALAEVNYYKVTTGFVNDVIENNYTANGKSFHTLRITGASLGGGLAIITGGQTRANAVAISGLNAVLTRHSVDPQMTEEQLNERVFNVIPDRDIVARVGDKSRLYQKIDCKAPINSFFGCHSMWRTMCELSYTCGTVDRAVMCQCAEKFGYPEPIPKENGTRSFAEACAQEESLLPEDF